VCCPGSWPATGHWRCTKSRTLASSGRAAGVATAGVYGVWQNAEVELVPSQGPMVEELCGACKEE